MKWIDFVGRKRTISAAVCLLAAIGMFYTVNYPLMGVAATARQLPIYCVQRDQKVVSISFDAAWGDVILRQ